MYFAQGIISAAIAVENFHTSITLFVAAEEQRLHAPKVLFCVREIILWNSHVLLVAFDRHLRDLFAESLGGLRIFLKRAINISGLPNLRMFGGSGHYLTLADGSMVSRSDDHHTPVTLPFRH